MKKLVFLTTVILLLIVISFQNNGYSTLLAINRPLSGKLRPAGLKISTALNLRNLPTHGSNIIQSRLFADINSRVNGPDSLLAPQRPQCGGGNGDSGKKPPGRPQGTGSTGGSDNPNNSSPPPSENEYHEFIKNFFACIKNKSFPTTLLLQTGHETGLDIEQLKNLLLSQQSTDCLNGAQPQFIFTAYLILVLESATKQKAAELLPSTNHSKLSPIEKEAVSKTSDAYIQSIIEFMKANKLLNILSPLVPKNPVLNLILERALKKAANGIFEKVYQNTKSSQQTSLNLPQDQQLKAILDNIKQEEIELNHSPVSEAKKIAGFLAQLRHELIDLTSEKALTEN